jgi:hypothetical protein
LTTNFSGTWSANIAKSRFLAPPPRAISVKIEQSNLELREEITVKKHDGSEDQTTFQCWLNGDRDKNLLNGMPIRGYARWEGKELIIESRIQLGSRELYFCDSWSLSSDGTTLVMEHRTGDLARQRTVLERVE